MSALITARDLEKTYSSRLLFRGVSIGVNAGDRLGIIGPNGAGKSTLMRILAGLDEADSGSIVRRRSLRQAYVEQDDVFEEGVTPYSVVVDHLESRAGEVDSTLPVDTRASMVLSRLGFDDPHRQVSELSGGWKKRLSIACGVAEDPDVLLLDEPTNHLDLEGVLWLERFVRESDGALVFVTHDRYFLDTIASRVVELSSVYPGGKFEVVGNYSEFIRRKEELLEAQAKQESALAGKVRRDTAWLKQGVKARRTRNQSQLGATIERKAALGELRGRNNAPGIKAVIEFDATDRKTKKLIVGHRLTKSLGGKLLFDKLDVTLSPGMRLGLLGPNGSGKTTLLRTLAGQIEVDSGTVKRASDLRLAHFNQHRVELDPTQKLRDALCPIGDFVHYAGKQVHVAGWADRFLFDKTKFNTTVGDLSGGEQARIMIANLMLQKAEVLVLDEPTNDLDIATLEVLEGALMEFPGAIVLVTHDRFMLQRLATELLALDGGGGWKMFSSYEQWQGDARWRSVAPSVKGKAGGSGGDDGGDSGSGDGSGGGKSEAKKEGGARGTVKLSYILQRELDMMEGTILEAEERVKALEKDVNNPGIMADHKRAADAYAALGKAQTRVRSLYERWAELEAMSKGEE